MWLRASQLSGRKSYTRSCRSFVTFRDCVLTRDPILAKTAWESILGAERLRVWPLEVSDVCWRYKRTVESYESKRYTEDPRFTESRKQAASRMTAHSFNITSLLMTDMYVPTGILDV